MAKQLTFEIGFNVDSTSINKAAQQIRNEFGGKTAASINTISNELNRQISILELYQKTGEASTKEVEDGFRDIERQLKNLPLATNSVIQTQSRLADAQGRLAKSSAGLGQGVKGTNNTLIDFGRVIQDAPFGLIGVANNIDPLIQSFGRLKNETGSTKSAFSALLAGLTGPAGIAIAVSAITSALIAFGPAIKDFFTEPTIDATKVAEKYADSLQTIATELNKAQGVKGVEAIKNEIALLDAQLEELNKQEALQPSFFDKLGASLTGAFTGTAVSTFQTLGKESNQIGEDITIIEARKISLQEQLNALKRIENSESAQNVINTTKELEIQNKLNEALKKTQTPQLESLGLDDLIAAEKEKAKDAKDFRLQLAKDFLVNEEAIRRQQLTLIEANAAKEIATAESVAQAKALIQEQGFNFANDLLLTLEQTGIVSARNAFNLNKGLAIADATINSYAGFTKALAAYPPPFNFIAAGAVLAAGLAKVAAIASTKFNPKGGGSSGGGARGSIGGGGEGFTVARAQPTQTNAGTNAALTPRPSSSNQPTIIVQNTIDERGLVTLTRRGDQQLNNDATTLTNDV